MSTLGTSPKHPDSDLTGSGVTVPRRRRRGKPGGMALVITLVILVLMVGLGMAFFSKVHLDRTIRGSSAAKDHASILARSAVALIVGDLLQEIAAGSGSDPSPPGVDGVSYFPPITVATSISLLGSSTLISTMPSIVPQKNVTGALITSHPDLLKESRRDIPFFSVPAGSNPGYALHEGIGAPSVRASAISTSTPSSRGRGIPASVWEWPGLGDASNPANSSPDWIYLDRSANTPVFTGNQVGNAANREKVNANYVIGRFAYRLYDVGGLLDLNLLGDPAIPSGSGNRITLSDIPLTPPPALPGLTDPAAGAGLLSLATWRAGDASGSREFVSRREMMRTVSARAELPDEAVRWFHVGSRFTESPSYGTDPAQLAANPANLEADLLNPALPGIRFVSETTLDRGSENSVTVAAGSPVMPRKFPLRKIDLLSDPDASAADLNYYFGLTRQPDGTFRYTAADAAGVIKDLTSVSAEGREPNFFEVLQAVIATGSLGRNAGNTYTVDHERDGLRSRQIWQIGANIIDQWDSDDYPTTVQYLVPATGLWESIHGVENVPYFNSIAIMGHRPQWDRDRFQLWAVFDVWNPHQEAGSPPVGIDAFRIVPRGGVTRISLNLATTNFNIPGTHIAHTLLNNGPQNVLPLNTNRAVTFSPVGNYAVPTTVGTAGPPLDTNWQGGVLLHDYENVPPAVPPNIENEVGNPAFSGLIASLNQYLQDAGLPTIGAEGGTFGAKAHNWYRFRSTPADKVKIDLQYRKSPGDPWITYQSIEDFLPVTTDPLPLTGGSNSSTTVTDGVVRPDNILQDTLISENPTNTNREFYGWRFDTPGSETEDLTRTGFTLVKYDPRSVRFGHNELRRTQRGRTIRESVATPSYTGSNVVRDLLPGWMMLRTGAPPFSAYIAGIQDIFTLQPTDAMQWERLSVHFMPFGYLANIPEAALSTTINPSRYRDRDGVIRPADGYLGAVPTALPISPGDSKGGRGDRPVLLNRPFHSVGEMGYAFRDLPWKSMDFFTRNSADTGLLDAFAIDASDGATPVVLGKINLNSVSKPVLSALLQGTGHLPDGAKPMSAAEADSLATAIVNERESNGPFTSVGDVARRALSPSAHNLSGAFNPVQHRKSEREAGIRTLSAIGDTRTWNLLLDLVVQSGRIVANASSADQFAVRAEKRYWVHLSVDRFTGELIHQNWEPVYE